jgi:hypothetical protein
MRYAVGEKVAQVLQDKMTEEKSCQAASLLRKIEPDGVQSESLRFAVPWLLFSGICAGHS